MRKINNSIHIYVYIFLACRPFVASYRNPFSLYSNIYTTLVEHTQEEHAQELGNPDEYTQEPIDLDEQMKILFSEIIKDIRQLPSDYDNPKIQALKDALNDKAGEKIGVRSVINKNFNFDNYPDSIALNNPTVNKLIEEIDNSSNDMEMGNNTPRWSGEKNRQLLQN